MAGLIAARYFRDENPTILEKQRKLPHNHHAILRFKTDVISKVTGIPFREVFVHKAAVHDSNFIDEMNIYAANQYSLKTTGHVRDRSIWNLDDEKRYIAPENFIQKLAGPVTIEYDSDFNFADHGDHPVISTIPMPVMMKKAGWPYGGEFSRRKIWTLNAQIMSPDVEVFQTIYFTSNDEPAYRASIVGNQFIVEFVDELNIGEMPLPDVCDTYIDFFGIPPGTCLWLNVELQEQEYGKIVPVNDDMRKEFIYMLTREYNIYSLGRYATWRQLLLDDLVNDLDVIKSIMGAEGKRKLYHQRIISAK